MPEKSEMLMECRRIATDRAEMLFSVIAVTRNLPEADHRRAVDAGPPFVDAPNNYVDLLEECGWRLKEHIDVTAEHRRSLSALVKAFDDSAELSAALGVDVVSQARKRRQEQIAVIDAGLLVREILVATASDNKASRISPMDL
jgi:CheY-like chemotaxis protein